MDLSVYIHIPYCLRKCPYCDFVSYDNLDLKHEEYIEGVTKELGHYAAVLDKPSPAKTVYLGGGTPSLLHAGLVEKILSEVRRHLGIKKGAEITIEANPGALDMKRLRGYREAGVNRISIGVQSTDLESLRVLGRIHTAHEGRRAYLDAHRAGFETVGIDLIFGLPGQTAANWAKDLREALSWKPDHVSAYILKAPKGWQTPDEETISQMYIDTVAAVEASGLKQYEISNFATPGKQSRHNSVYWNGDSYLGLGAAAHSFIAGAHRRGGFEIPRLCGTGQARPCFYSFKGPMRWSNEERVDIYLDRIRSSGQAIARCEYISEEMARDEAIMLGLRLKAGLDVKAIGFRFGEGVRMLLTKGVRDLRHQGLATLRGGRIKLTLKGMLVADEIAVRLASLAVRVPINRACPARDEA